MVGPVFLLEWLNACRGGRHHLFRLVYSAVILVEFLFFAGFWVIRVFVEHSDSALERVAELAWVFFHFFAYQHFVVILLTTPVLAAGTVADEKTRGTLALVLTTQLTAGEIVLGKWLGAVSQVLVLACPVVPMLGLLAAILGLPAEALLGLVLRTVVLAMTLAAAGLLASVWARRTTTAVLGAYLLSLPLCAAPMLLEGAPFQLILDGNGNALFLSLCTWFGLCGLALGLAVWRLRPVFARQGGEGQRRRTAFWFARPAVSEQPLRWKEHFVGELGFLSFLRRVPEGARKAGVFLMSLALSLAVGGDDPVAALAIGLGFMLAISNIVGIRSSGVISSERERQTWESLLLTPLEPRQFVRGKMWGIIDGVRPYMLAYLVPTAALSVRSGAWGVLCTLYCWAAAWGLLYFQGANGLYWSTRSSSSWQSLLKTLTSSAWMMLTRGFILGVSVTAFLLALLQLIPGALGGSGIMFVCLVGIITPMVLHLFSHAEYLLLKAEETIAQEDRVLQTWSGDWPGFRLPKT